MRNGWTTTKLGERIQTLKGYAFKSEWYSNVGVPLVKVSNFTDDSIDVEGLTRIPDEISANYERYTLKTNDVIIQTVGSWPTNPQSVVGKVIRVPNKANGALLNQNAVKIIPDTSVDIRFLFYALKLPTFKNYIVGCAQGAASQASITLEAIKNYDFTFPTLERQRDIAAVLSAYDNLIENNMRRVQILEEIARLIYEEWFIRFHFPGHENVEMVNSELGLIPEGWEIAAVSNVANFARGKSYKSSELSDTDNGLPFVNLKCIDRDGGFRKSGLKRFTGAFKENHKVSQGDVVVAITDMTQERRIVARCGRVPRLDNEFGIISMDLVKMIPNPAYSNEYIYSMLRWSGFADEVKLHANGANVLHLSPERILEFRFPNPPDSFVEAFTVKIQPTLLLIDALNGKNEKLREIRDLLLPKLISGEIDVSNLPEPKSV